MNGAAAVLPGSIRPPNNTRYRGSPTARDPSACIHRVDGKTAVVGEGRVQQAKGVRELELVRQRDSITGRRDDLAVDHQTGRAVVMECRHTENAGQIWSEFIRHTSRVAGSVNTQTSINTPEGDWETVS